MAELSGDQSKLLGQELSSLNRFSGSTQVILFEILFSMLKNEDISVGVSCGLTLIQYMQIIYFAFHPVVNMVWNSSIIDTLSAIFGYTAIVHIYQSSMWMVYIVLFYFGVGLIFIYTCVFIYCFFTIKRQRVISDIVYKSMRLGVNLILTILFIPFLDTFLSIVNCVSIQENGFDSKKTYVQLYNNIECWQGMHIFHASSGIICSIILICYGLLFGLLYFNGIHNESKLNSKRNSRAVLSIIIYEIILVIFYNFLSKPEYRAVLIALFFCGSLITFYLIHLLAPFNHPRVMKYWSVFTTAHMWTGIMLLMAYLIEKRIFHGIVYAWIIGMPLMVFIILWSPLQRQKRETGSTINVNKFNSAQEVIDHSTYVLRLIIAEQAKQQQGQLLNGYIEFHNKTCLTANCPLKKIKFQSMFQKRGKKHLNTSSIKDQESLIKQDKRYNYTYEMITKLFEQGISKFPTNIPLRIYYSVFLMSTMRSKQHALNEVLDAENFKCTIDESYTLYFIKRTIETQIAELTKDGGGGDYSQQKSLDQRMQHFKSAMEQTVTLLMEFWSQFSDDKPDLIKLYDIGSKLFPLKMMVDDMWKKISRNKNDQIPKILRLYSKYQLDIFNDRQLGIDLLQRAQKIEMAFHNRKDIYLNYTSDLNIDGQEDGIIFMAMDDERLGQIIAVNLPCQNIFGFTKPELLNKNVSVLMPYIYSQYHDDFLKRYLETNEITFANRDKVVYAKTKVGYIYPIQIHVKPVYHALKDNIEFFAIFRREKLLRNYGFICVSHEGHVKDISASCANLIGLDIKTAFIQVINITQLFPDLLTNKEEYTGKNGKTLDFILPKITDEAILFGKGNQTVRLNVWLQEISFKVKQDAGFIVKIEMVVKKVHRLNKSKIKGGNLFASIDNQKELSFQFKLTVQDDMLKYYGEFFENQAYCENINNTFMVENSDMVSESQLFINTQSNVIMLKSQRQQQEDEDKKKKEQKIQESVIEEQDKKINYGEGIKTVRLYNGGFQEIEKDDDDDEESQDNSSEEERERKSQQRQHQMYGQSGNEEQKENQQDFMDTGFHSAKELNDELSKQSESLVVQHLKYFSFFVILTMIGIAIADYVIKYNTMQDQKNFIDCIVMQSNRLSEIQSILAYVRELSLLNKNIRIPQYSIETNEIPTNITDEKKLREKLEKSIRNVQNLTTQINKISLLDINQVDIYFDSNKTSVFDINYATQQIISKSHNILKLSLQNITEDQSDTFFVLYNSLNDYIKTILERYNYANQQTKINLENIESDSLTFLILSICIMIFFSIILTIFMGRTLFAKQLILTIFLEIPERTAKYLYTKCESFLTSLTSGDDDDVQSQGGIDDLNEKDQDEERASIFGQRKKKFKNADQSSLGFFIKMLLIAIFVEAYFVINYVLGGIDTVNQNELLYEFNVTTLAEGYYGLTLNSELQMLIDDEWPIQKQKSTTLIPIMIETMYDIDGAIHKEHAKNTEQHNNSVNYLGAFENVMFKDVCDIVVLMKGSSQNECAQFAHAVVTQGMITTVIRYFQLIRYIKDRFDWCSQNPGKAFDFSAHNFSNQTKNFSTNITRNNIINIIRMPETYELIALQTQYIKMAFRHLENIFKEEMFLLMDNYSVQRVLLLVLFIIVLIFASFMCWTPFLAQLNKEIWSTKCLLSFIPVDEMTKIKAISNFIREFILDRKI